MEIDTIQVQIAAGQSLSPQVDIGTKSLVGIQIPANWTTAAIAFQVSIDGGATWGPLLTTGGSATPYAIASVTGGAQAYVAVDPSTLRGAVSFKVQSGTAASPVNQTNLVTINLITRLAV